MAGTVVGSAQDFANWCLSWAQAQLGIAHVGGTAVDAFNIYSSQGLQTSTPQAGDLVFFGAAPVNAGNGHVGIVDSAGTGFTSVWSNGKIVSQNIAQFAQQNGTNVLGFISRQKLGGQLPDAGWWQQLQNSGAAQALGNLTGRVQTQTSAPANPTVQTASGPTIGGIDLGSLLKRIGWFILGVLLVLIGIVFLVTDEVVSAKATIKSKATGLLS